MPNYKVTLDAKDKKTENCQCTSFQELNNWIDKIFNIEIKNIKFKKPRIKDQPSFQKEVKDGVEILILGNPRKQKTPQQMQKQKKLMQQVQKMRQQLKMTPHQKIIKKLKQNGIKQRGIQFFNTQTGKPEDLGIQYSLCPLHLLRIVPQFKRYCYNYQVMQKNPDGLIIEELACIFKQLQKGQGIVCPLEWISAWITYCADDIQFPYPTYQLDYFLNKTFNTIKSAFQVQLQKKEQQPNSRVDTASKLFGIEVLTKRTDLTKLDEDDTQPQKEIDKKVIKYVLECDLSKPQFNSLISGIRQRFKQKTLWRNFYAFDIQYKQKILSIQRLPKYIFVHATRWGYPLAKQQSQRIDLFEHKKSYHKVRFGRIIDLYDLCDPNLKQRLDLGRYERHQMFYPYDMDERYPAFKKQIPNIQQMSDVEIKYRFFDHILYQMGIFHNFFFQPIKNAKPTGEYRLIGIVLHRGDYYHHPDSTHKHQKYDCKGEFMTLAYSNGRRWIKYKKAQVEYIDVEDAMNQKYWGKQGEWTPVLFMYREIYMRNMQIQQNKDKKPKKSQPEKQKMKKQEMQG